MAKYVSGASERSGGTGGGDTEETSEEIAGGVPHKDSHSGEELSQCFETVSDESAV